ncbi:MAG: DUF2461 domain-containing protein [Acidobacteria bacterium]|jgi:uncharacterized protein (TIGR02453 family)|nr:DUF2461 domain-containing protein [Acidobacteriota bacterium]
MTRASFSPELFTYLKDLKRNNRREWFLANKGRYEEEVKGPALRFIADFEPHLRKISPEFLAIPRAVGGSLFRIQRDVRFSKDKSPYKTHVGIRFLHRDAKNVHAPIFYLHLEPGGSFAALGVWHPEPATLEQIRQAIVEGPGAYRRAAESARLRKRFEMLGDSLQRPPRGYDPEHPLIEELKRKDFVASRRLDEKDIVRAGFDRRLAEAWRDGAGYVRFLCRALDVPF